MRSTRTGKSWLCMGKGWAAVVALSLVLVGTAGCPPVTPPPIDDDDGPPTFAAGLNIVVEDVSIPADLRPEVIFRIQDDAGNPVAFGEVTAISMILAHLGPVPEVGTNRYTSYTTRIENPDGIPESGDEAIQATYDSAGRNGVTRNADGTFTYKFAAALPADYDAGATHQLAGQATRRYFVDNALHRDNFVFTFVPDGSPVSEIREVVVTETCNVCHTDLVVHGQRREVQLCILCHQPQTSDAQSGNLLDMAEMIHKIHRGADLPSVQQGDPYFIVGFQNSVHDYSDVHYPQDIRNCQSCHTNAEQDHFWQTEPTLLACAACHDRTWFGHPAATPAGFTNHIGGQQVNDALCSACHTPTAPGVSPIAEAHMVPTKSPQAPGLDLTITDVLTLPVEGGVEVTIDFTAVDKNDVPYESLAELNSVAANIAWPAEEYETNVREAIAPTPAGTLVNNGGGSYSYTFRRLLPDSDEVFSVGMEGRLRFTFKGQTITQGLEDPSITHFTLDGAEVAGARRMIVSDQKCNACHDDLRFHGEQRVGANYCVFCHNPNGTDIARRPADQLPPETIDFKVLIHKIHRGEDLEGPFTVYGFGNVPHDYTDLRFPGDESKCTICHLPGTYDLPLPNEVLPTVVRDAEGTILSETLPASAACTACHDSISAFVHAALQTDFNRGIESCAVCHGPGAAFDVERVHGLR
jgi:OmcA/MtrC family decaheme c-type cytochrome